MEKDTKFIIVTPELLTVYLLNENNFKEVLKCVSVLLYGSETEQTQRQIQVIV